MDNERVRNYFGKRNDFNAFQNNSVATPQPIISNDGSNTFPTTAPDKNRKKFLFLGIGGALVLIIFFVVALIVSQSSVRSDGGVTDAEVLTLMEESYSKISRVQKIVIRGKEGRNTANGFFTEKTKDNINNGLLGTIYEFSDALNRYDPNLISQGYARENFLALRDVIKKDLQSYDYIVKLYNLFYDYVNSGYNDSYAEDIVGLNDEKASKALENLDNTVLEYGHYEVGTIDQDIFNAALGENYPEVYYYDLIGKVIAGLRNDE